MQHKKSCAAAVVVAGTALSLLAGGLGVQIGNPAEHPEALARHAVLVVRPYSCGQNTRVSATAEGLVGDQWRSIPLRLEALSEKGSFTLSRQWPGDGKWVIAIVVADPKFGFTPTALVPVTGEQADFDQIQRLNHKPSAADLRAALAPGALAAR